MFPPVPGILRNHWVGRYSVTFTRTYPFVQQH